MTLIRNLTGLIGLLGSLTAWAGIELSVIETKWLQAAEPVLEFAQSQNMPIDISIQLANAPNAVPLSMGVQDGRCKLILSLRDNPEAEATLATVPVAQHAMLIEAMAAHELAHCWRYLQGQWLALPAGFAEPSNNNADSDLVTKLQQMRATRREEGFADLVALAWTSQHHPTEYSFVYAWLAHIRDDQPMRGSYHDTRAWLTLVRDAAIFPSAANVFEQVKSAWIDGLSSE